MKYALSVLLHRVHGNSLYSNSKDFSSSLIWLNELKHRLHTDTVTYLLLKREYEIRKTLTKNYALWLRLETKALCLASLDW